MRGHLPAAHKEMDMVSLELVFRAWQPYGALTSLPLLDGSNFWRKPSEEEFRFGFHNTVKNNLLYLKHKPE
jgi:hypothetical protein